MADAYPQELVDEARSWRALGLGHKRIAALMGIPYSTVFRWLNPEYAERSRAVAREWKRSQKGVCEKCGGVTRYSGHGRSVSTRCVPCTQEDSKYWTRARIIAAMQEWAREHGHRPSAVDWRASGDGHPASSTVVMSGEFASWADAVEAAGFPRPRSSPGCKTRWVDRDAARGLRSEGFTDAEIARRFSVSPSAIYQALGARRDAT